MVSKAYTNIRGPLHIETLPQRLKLKVSDVKRIERWNKLLKTSRPHTSGIANECQNDENGLFQMLLRAGAEDRIESFLKKHGLDVLKSKFFIHINLREIKWKNIKDNIQDDSSKQSIPTQPEEDGSVCLESGKSNFLTNHEIVICDESSNIATNHNARIHVNALHLAILAQQSRAVECILKCLTDKIIEDHAKQAILFDILDRKIKLEKVSNVSSDLYQFTNDDLCLKEMNAFHLS